MRKMQNMKYKGDIMAYLNRLQFLNERASITKAALRNIVHKALPNEIIWMLPICGGMDMDKQIWKTVKKASKAHEEAEYIIKVKSSGGGSGGESLGRKEKVEEEGSSSRCRSRGKGKEKKSSTNIIT